MNEINGATPTRKDRKTNAKAERRARLEAELKSNIARRKAQARNRKDDAGDAENMMKNDDSKADF